MSEHFNVAEEAITQLNAAVETLNQLESLLKAACRELDRHTEAARLIALGVYAAMDQANGFDCAREDLQRRLNESAPQNAASPVRGAEGVA